MPAPSILRSPGCLVALAALAVACPTWATVDDPNGTWHQLSPANPPSTYRKYFTAVYDPVRQQLIVDGGRVGPSNNCAGDTWTLSLSGAPIWMSVPQGWATPRERHVSIYDPLRDRMLFFGWSDCDLLGYYTGPEVLNLGAVSWGALATTGTAPAGRVRHTMIYDPIRDQMIAFGGELWATLPPQTNEVWTLSLSGTPTWTHLTPTGTPPSARSSHTAIYDPVGDRMVVFGGTGAGGRVNDVWALSLSGTPTWTQLTPTGTPPDGRSRHTAIYDPVRDRMVVFAGFNSAGQQTNDAWALSLGGTPAWTQLGPAGTLPLAREGHVAIYDPGLDRMIVYGGQNPPDDLWSLDWNQVVGIPPIPGEARLSLSAGPVPAASRISVDFSLPRAGAATVRLYDTQGRLVRSLFDGEAAPSGAHLVWDGRDARRQSAGPGVFFLELRFAGTRLIRRVVMVD